jgi:hypothetical protein
MNIFHKTNQIIGYFSDAIAVIFSVDQGEHPTLGIQSFIGDIHRRHS